MPTVSLLKTRPDFGSIVTSPSSEEPSLSLRRPGAGAPRAATAELKMTMTRHQFTGSVFPEKCDRAKSKLPAELWGYSPRCATPPQAAPESAARDALKKASVFNRGHKCSWVSEA